MPHRAGPEINWADPRMDTHTEKSGGGDLVDIYIGSESPEGQRVCTTWEDTFKKGCAEVSLQDI